MREQVEVLKHHPMFRRCFAASPAHLVQFVAGAP